MYRGQETRKDPPPRGERGHKGGGQREEEIANAVKEKGKPCGWKCLRKARDRKKETRPEEEAPP